MILLMRFSALTVPSGRDNVKYPGITLRGLLTHIIGHGTIQIALFQAGCCDGQTDPFGMKRNIGAGLIADLVP
jgi:hypothetical protein